MLSMAIMLILTLSLIQRMTPLQPTTFEIYFSLSYNVSYKIIHAHIQQIYRWRLVVGINMENLRATMNNLGRGPPNNATQHISKLLNFLFQTRFSKFPIHLHVKLVVKTSAVVDFWKTFLQKERLLMMVIYFLSQQKINSIQWPWQNVCIHGI